MGRTMPLVPRMEMPPLNAQPWVKGAPRQGLPRGDGDHRPQPAGVASPGRGGLQLLLDHAAGGGVDGRLPPPAGRDRAGSPGPPPWPPSMAIPGPVLRSTRAQMSAPSVTSGSSPPSLRTAQAASLPRRRAPAAPPPPHPRRGVDVHGGQRGPSSSRAEPRRRRRRRRCRWCSRSAAAPAPPGYRAQFPHVCPPFDAKGPPRG